MTRTNEESMGREGILASKSVLQWFWRGAWGSRWSDIGRKCRRNWAGSYLPCKSL